MIHEDNELKSALSFSSIRSPGPVTPRDIKCEGFDLTYPRIASDKISAVPSAHSSLEYGVDKKVDDAIASFLLTLSQIGPELLSVSLIFNISACELPFFVLQSAYPLIEFRGRVV